MFKTAPIPAILLQLCFCSFAAQSETRSSIRRLDGSRISTTEAVAFAKTTLNAAHVTGAQIVIVDGGRIVWSEAFGLRRLDPKLEMNRETTLWAASITKSVFATYVMQLVERGEFQLDVPVVKQLPKPLHTYEPYLVTATELAKDPNWPTVTPRMLLSHSSGLHNFAFLEPDKKMHLRFKPGTQFLYSGEGLNIVQFLIEQQKQKPLNELMQEALFNPLGMTHSGMIYCKEFAENVSDRHNAKEGFISKTQRFPARASGSMTTSAEDLGRFAIALLTDKILKPANRKAMLTSVLPLRSLHQFPLVPNEPEGTEAAKVGLAYGVGWVLLTRTPFGPAFLKQGHGDGAQNYMICFEKRKACMILLTNSDNGEFAFRPLMEKLFGNTVTPWEWEGYTPAYIERARKNQ